MKYIAAISIALLSIKSFAQKNIDHQQAIWYMVFTDVKLSEKYYTSSDIQIRDELFEKNWQNFLIRTSIHRKINERNSIGMGYAFVKFYQYGKQPIAHNFDEHRIFQDFSTTFQYKSVKFKQRHQLEERILQQYEKQTKDFVRTANDFDLRYRYRLGAQIPIKKWTDTQQLFLSAFDEIFINVPFSNNKTFNQNWLYLSLGFQVNKNLHFEAGYLNQYLEKGNNFDVESNSNWQIKTALKF